MEELNKIKKLLPNMVSADLILVVDMAVKQLRIACIKESHGMFKVATDPKTVKYLQSFLNRRG